MSCWNYCNNPCYTPCCNPCYTPCYNPCYDPCASSCYNPCSSGSQVYTIIPGSVRKNGSTDSYKIHVTAVNLNNKITFNGSGTGELCGNCHGLSQVTLKIKWNGTTKNITFNLNNLPETKNVSFINGDLGPSFNFTLTRLLGHNNLFQLSVIYLAK